MEFLVLHVQDVVLLLGRALAAGFVAAGSIGIAGVALAAGPAGAAPAAALSARAAAAVVMVALPLLVTCGVSDDSQLSPVT